MGVCVCVYVRVGGSRAGVEGEERRLAATVFYLQPGDFVEERHVGWLIQGGRIWSLLACLACLVRHYAAAHTLNVI